MTDRHSDAHGLTSSFLHAASALAWLPLASVVSSLHHNDTELSWRVLRSGRKLADVWQPDDGTVLHHAEASSRPGPPGLRLRFYRLRVSLGARARGLLRGRSERT